jgi:thiamine transporter ThiT
MPLVVTIKFLLISSTNSNFAKEYDSMKRLNEMLNIIIGSVIGAFVLRTLYYIWDFKTYSKFYAMQSAPWYTSLLADGAFTLVVSLICIVIKVIIKKKCKNTK